MTVGTIEIRQATPEDLKGIKKFLIHYKLPVEGIDCENSVFVVAIQKEKIVGCAGVERYGSFGLLRSVSVSESLHGTGLGSKLTHHILQFATQQKMSTMYLLTETAEVFFKRKGFITVERRRVPDAIKASQEFSSLCPQSAVVMELAL